MIYRHFLRTPHNLLERYGTTNSSWALVTGASDGIGAEYCRQLAVMGFNVCLVSRTLSKLEAVDKQVKALNPSIKTRIVQADFSNTTMNYFESIKI